MALRPAMALGGILLFAGASFFFALAESALFSLGKWRAQQLAEHSAQRGQKVLALLSNPQALLATTVLGNTFANAGLIATALWFGLEGEWPILWTLAGALVVVLVGCEVVPKTLAVRSAERWSLRVVVPMLFFQRFTQWPRNLAQQLNAVLLRLIVPKTWKPQIGLTDEEYTELFELAYQQGTLARSEKEIILQIIQLDRRTVKDAMKPRPQMACIPDDLSVEDMIAAAKRFKHRRLPLYDETPDTIVGVLNTRTLLLAPDTSLEEAIEFPSFVPETMNLLQLFRSFQRQQRGLAIVLDEFGGTAGLVTMEDILEQVIGELRTEGQAEAFVFEKLAPDRWRVSGTMRLDDFRREYPELGEVEGAETMGGWLVNHLGVVPAQGESALLDGLRLTARIVDERRVRELLVEVVKRRRNPGRLDKSTDQATGPNA
ncbi:MAG: hemolysin family protein [Verrucomicrobiales bacterium]|nr:hemolysin family protein [Verrucomicrobiales bacterium]